VSCFHFSENRVRMLRHSPATVLAAVLIAGLSAFFVAGCSPAEHDPIVASVGTQTIPLSEFERQYLKTIGTREAGAATSLDDRQKFLDLLVKYRLKLAEAYRSGLDKKPEIISEMEGYKGNLAATYLTDREVVTPGIKTLYDRRQEEIRSSHILLTLGPDASPTDTALAYAKAMDLIGQIKKGRSFEDVAVQASQDPSAKQNKGDLYYVTAGQLVSPFEDAIYAMKPGEITEKPVRTRFGYHIIKVVDRRPAPNEIRAGHIMIRFSSQSPTPDDTAKAYARASAILDSLKQGIDFNQLAIRNSEDQGSASKGGDLGFFGRRRWVQPFDEVAFTLQPGQVSGIVRTPWGYHIIKCFETRPKKSFDEARAELQTAYQQSRFSEDNTRYLAQLRSMMRVTKNDTLLASIIAVFDSTKSVRDTTWDRQVPSSMRKQTLVTVNGGPVSVDSIFTLIATRPETQNTALTKKEFPGAVEKIADQLAFSARANQLAKERPEFGDLMSEYKEGVLLYQTEQDHIWNKIAMNDSLMLPYFESHRESFTFPDRVSFTAVHATTEAKAGILLDQLKAGKSMEAAYTEDSTRMAKPRSFRELFAARSAAISRQLRATLKAIATDLKSDTLLRVAITARPDTTGGKDMALGVAKRRLDAVENYLVKTLKVNAKRVSVFTVPSPASAKRDSLADQAVDLLISGREALVLGRPEQGLAPASGDERAKRADSLVAGAYSRPFPYRGMFAIVRLDGHEKARQKTFEEAGSELASAFQEFESKRLESEWMTRLRREFPVVENTATLKEAFAPKK
jgi:peptidyl-prolyl cis-trans isomerase SurA